MITNQAKADITSNLVGYWPMNEGTASTTADLSSWLNNATLVTVSSHGPSWASGVIGTWATNFATSSGGGGYVKVTSTTTSGVNNIWATGGTVSFWTQINSAGPSNAGYWMDKTKWTILSPGAGYFTSTSTGMEFDISWSGGTSVKWKLSGGQFPIGFGTWHHIAITYNANATTTTPIFYLDGLAYTPTQAAATTTGTYASDASNNLAIGGNAAASRTLDGQMDDVRLYTRILSPSEINDLRNLGVPNVSAQAASSITQNTATLNGSIDSIGGTTPTLRGFYYGLSTAYGSTSSSTGSFSTGAYTANVTNLICNSTYHYSSFAVNTGGTGSSTDQTFNTGACAPILTTGAASPFASTTATLSGTLTSTGGDNPTIEGIVYGLTSSYGSTSSTTGSFSPGSFSQNITGLTPNTTYHYAAFATNIYGTAYGSDQTFTTNVSYPFDIGLVNQFDQTTNSSSVSNVTTITFKGSISAGKTVVVPIGWEVGNTFSLGSVTDSRGNSWTIQAQRLNSTVHQLGLISAYIVTPIQTNDTLNIFWSTTIAQGQQFAGEIIAFTGGDTYNTPNLIRSGQGNSSSVTFPGTTTVPNSVIVGAIQLQQPRTYSNSSWNSIGPSQNFGQSSSTIGLTNFNLYTMATSTGVYDLLGNLDTTDQWQTIWAAFSPSTNTPSVVAPTLTTSPPTSVSTSSLTLNANISSTGGGSITNSGFAYGTNSSLSTVIATSSTGSQSGTGNFSLPVTNLTPNTAYYFRAYAVNSAGTSTGSILSTTTITISAPTVTTQAASSITAISAIGNGTVALTGNIDPTIRGFVYGLTSTHGATTSSSGDFNTGAYTNSITGLSCNTTYHVAAFATNSQGTGYGSDQTFTTSACLPTLTTSVPTSVSTSSITFNASITSTGGADATQSGFAYGTNSSLSTVIATTTLGAQTGTASFSQTPSSLSPNTTYYFRAYAVNSAGTSTGSILSTTTVDTTPPSITITAPSGGATVAGNAVTLSANASDDVGVVGVQFKLDGTTNIGSEDTVAPYSITWDSTSIISYGSHTISAVARDAAGNYATTSLSVNVDNVAPTLLSAVRNSDTQITVTLTKLANSSTITKSNTGGFTVIKTGSPGTTYTVSSIAPGSDNTKVVLTVANMTTAGGTGVAVTYTNGGNGTVADTVGNLLATDGTGKSITPWNTANPTISNITTSFSSGAYKAGTAIDINLTFSKAVSSTGSVTVTMNTGGTCSFTVSNSTTASCTYTVSGGENTNTLNVSSVSGTITSTDSNPMISFVPASNITDSGKTIIIDTSIPLVTLTVPASGSTVSGTSVTLTATNSDANSNIAGVQFKLDGVNIGSEGATNPYTITWNSKTVSSASHTLSAVARDNAGNYATSSITITVENTAPGKPTSVSATGGDTQAVVSFLAPVDNGGASITGYTVISSPTGGTDSNYGSTNLSHTVTGLTNGTPYTFTVTATNANGTSSASDPSNSVTPNIVPIPPTLTLSSITNISTSSLTLSANITVGGTASSTSRGFNYGTSQSYGSTVSTSGTYGLGTYSQNLTGLSCGTTYHYQAFAVSTAGTGTSADSTFATHPCATFTQVIPTASQGTLSFTAADTSHTISLVIPAAVASNNAEFGVTEANPTTVVSQYSKPASTLVAAASKAYVLFAAQNTDSNTFTTFAHPVTVTMNYSPSDISGITESTLKIYRYDDGQGWQALDSCVVDTDAHTVSCTTTGFSTFMIFGSSSSVSSSSNSSTSSSGGSSALSRVNNLLAMGFVAQAQAVAKQYGIVIPNQASSIKSSKTTSTKATFTRNLSFGMSGSDVLALQKFLNSHGFIITKTGAGSPGHENGVFGPATKAALMKFQLVHKKEILDPQGLKSPNGVFGPGTMRVVLGLMK